MASNWQEYQEEVAEFFRSIGMNAEVDKVVHGVRGTHAIDVWVTFDRYGINFKWIVECKFWKTAVPKEKVLVLQQITQDIGADRAFLLSEKGFQAGAVKVVKSSNVTLTNLNELKTDAQDDIFETVLKTLDQQTESLFEHSQELFVNDYGNPYRPGSLEFDEAVSINGALLLLKLALPKRFLKKFPISFSSLTTKDLLTSVNEEQLIKNTEIVLNEASEAITQLENRLREIVRVCKREFIGAVENLIHTSESALFSPTDDEKYFEEARLKALNAMKAVGEKSEELRGVAKGEDQQQLKKIMRILIDTVYLHLTKENIPTDEWNTTKELVAGKLKHFTELS